MGPNACADGFYQGKIWFFVVPFMLCVKLFFIWWVWWILFWSKQSVSVYKFGGCDLCWYDAQFCYALDFPALTVKAFPWNYCSVHDDDVFICAACDINYILCEAQTIEQCTVKLYHLYHEATDRQWCFGSLILTFILSTKLSRPGIPSLRPFRLRAAMTTWPVPELYSHGSPLNTCQWSKTHWGNACPPVLLRRSAVKPVQWIGHATWSGLNFHNDGMNQSLCIYHVT